MVLLVIPYAIATFLFTLLTYLLAPILALTVNTDRNLPRYLRYFQTFDASVDEGWIGGYDGFGNYPRWDYTSQPKGLELWWYRVKWLWRNPGYTFDYEVLGIRWYAEDWEVLHHTDTLFFAINTYEAAFNLNLNVWRFRFKLGWKAWNHYNSGTKQFDGGNWSAFERIPFVASISLRKLPS